MALTRPKYSQIYDTDWKQSAHVATTADVGNLFLGNTQPNSIDGVNLSTSYRVLVKDQNAGTQNGIWEVMTVGSGSNGYWRRALDANQNPFVTAGLTVSIVSGSVNGGKEFKLTTLDPIVLDTTPLVFVNPFAAGSAGGVDTSVQFNDGGTFNGVSGFVFNKSANTVSISGNVTTGHLLPQANTTYDLGTPTLRWRTGYFAASTLDIGGSQISVDATNGFKFVVGGTGTPTYLASNGLVSGTSLSTSGTLSVGTNATVLGYLNVVGNIIATTAELGSVEAAGVIYANSTSTSTSTTTGALRVAGGAGIAGNLFVGGNLFIAGNLITYNSNNLTIDDSIIYLAANNPGDSVDIGLVGHFINPGYQHTGFVRDASDGVWKLFANVTTEPTTIIDFTNATYSNLLVGNILARDAIVTSIAAGSGSITTTGTVTAGIVNSTGNILATGSVLNALTVNGTTNTRDVLPVASNTYSLGSTTLWYTKTFTRAAIAQYADLAENYVPDDFYHPGTVMIFGGEKEVTISTQSHDPAIAGVVSTNPAYHMNAQTEGAAIALQGRVPTRVKGPIKKGDRVVASDIPGVAQRLVMMHYQPGCVIGKSLENINDDSIQTIEVVVGRV